MHKVERFVDVLKPHRVGYELIDFDVAIHVLIDHARQLRAALTASERSAPPDATGDQLERARAYFLTRSCNADDD